MSATSLSKIILATTFLAFVLYIVGFASPHWLQKDFVLKLPGALYGVPQLPTIDADVSSNMGLLRSCDDTVLKIPQNPMSSSDCGTDGAADWQTISAGLGIAAVVLTFFSLVACILRVFVSKFHYSIAIRWAVVLIDFLSAGLMLSCLIIYVLNKKIQVKPPLPDQIDYDLSWAFYITVTSTVLFSLLILLNVLDIVWNSSKSDVDISKEPSVAYYTH